MDQEDSKSTLTEEDVAVIKGLPPHLRQAASQHGPLLVIFRLNVLMLREALQRAADQHKPMYGLSRPAAGHLIEACGRLQQGINQLIQQVVMTHGWSEEQCLKADEAILAAHRTEAPRIVVPGGKLH